MDFSNVNFFNFHEHLKSILPYVIDAHVQIYGEKHRETMTRRAHNTCYITCYTPKSVREYINFLKDCKKKQLSVKFLKQISELEGLEIDFSKQEQLGYAEDLEPDIERLIGEYIYTFKAIGKQYAFVQGGCLAWLPEDKEFEKLIGAEDEYKKAIDKSKIEFINYLRGDEAHPQVTLENFEDFCKTQEYADILARIEKYLQIFRQMGEEYKEFDSTDLAPYLEYVKGEEERLKAVEDGKKQALYDEISPLLSAELQEYLNTHFSNPNEKAKALFNENFNKGLGYKTDSEYFSEEDERKLNDPKTSDNDKENIYYFRIMYLYNLGVAQKDADSVSIYNEICEKMHEFGSYEKFYKWCMEREGISSLIPPADAMSQLTKSRESAFEEYRKEAIHYECVLPENVPDKDDFKNALIEVVCEKEKIGTSCVTTLKVNNEMLMPMLFLNLGVSKRYDIRTNNSR